MIDPKCLKGTTSFGHDTRGFIMPCCWCAVMMTGDEGLKSLSQDHLKLSNVDSVEQIINSEEWNEFFRILKEQPEDAPQVCKHLCKLGYESKKYNQY
tara:strand:- start:37 stop:327 length:291 start_codon:yes stop_codon:yes gene_type:complete